MEAGAGADQLARLRAAAAGRDELDGRLIADPENPQEICRALDEMLTDADRLERWGQSAQRRVHDQFLVLAQLRAWGRLIATLLSREGG